MSDEFLEGKEIVDYNDIVHTGRTVHLPSGNRVDFGDGRRIEVWDIEGSTDRLIRIYKTLDDNTLSKLRFSLTKEASRTLAKMLIDKEISEGGIMKQQLMNVPNELKDAGDVS